MKQTPNLSLRSVASSREAIALATFFSIAHAGAQDVPKKNESPEKDKKSNGDGEVLDEVTVSADRSNPYNPQRVQSPKFTAPLVNTPQTVSVIPKEIFNQQGAQGLADVLKNTPGVTFLAGENGFVAGSNSLNIRGFDATNSIFVDGIRDNGNYGRDIFNVESVEIAKGPAGDNGRGSAGGYINLATKTPQNTNFYSGTAGYKFDETDANDHQRLTFDLNQVIEQGPLPGTAIRLNALLQGGGVAGRDYAENNSWGIAPSIAFGLGTETRFTLAYQYLEQTNIPDVGFPGNAVPDTSSPVRPSGYVDRENFYGLTRDFDDVSSHVIYARFEHDFSDRLRFNNLTRYNVTDRDAIYTVLGAFTAPSTVATTRQAFFRKTETFTNQSNLSAEFETGSLEHTFSGGLELIREKGQTLRDFSGLGTPGSTDIYHPDPSRPIGAYDPYYAFVDDVTVDSVAIYANDTVKFNEQWQASFGSRLEYFDAEAEYRDRATGTVFDYDSDDLIFSGKAGVVYKPKENGSIYVSYGVSALPPGANSLSNDNGSRNNGGPTPGSPTGGLSGNNNPDSDVQRSYNYEAGTKWEFFDKDLTTSLAVFRSERTNVATVNDALTGEPLDYGDQTVKGVELSASGNLTENWVIFGGIAYLDSENSDGNVLTFTPDWTANLWTTYRFPIGVTIGAGARYAAASTARIGTATSQEATLPESLIFDAMLSYEVTKNVTVRLNVNNLTDEFYARTLNTAADSRRAYLGESRSYTLSADWRF